MAEYGQFCPVSRGAEIFAERWTPLILRELLNGSHRFSELLIGLPRISRNLLRSGLRHSRVPALSSDVARYKGAGLAITSRRPGKNCDRLWTRSAHGGTDGEAPTYLRSSWTPCS
jgi:hypothetical protein